MKPESDPLSPDEMLIRLVYRDRFTNRVPIISPGSFEPRVKGNHPDTDGISLFRQDCLNDPEDALGVIAPDKRPATGIVLVPVGLLGTLNLTAVAKPIPQVPGHVVIPELNSTDYATRPSDFTHIKLALAEAASHNIVRRPLAAPPT